MIQKRTKDDGENKPKVLRSGRKVDAKVQGGLQAHRSHVSMANKDRGHRTKVTPKGVSQGTDGTPDRIPARQISYPIAETAVHDVSPTEDPVTEDTGTVSLIGPAPRTTTEDLQHARLIFDIFSNQEEVLAMALKTVTLGPDDQIRKPQKHSVPPQVSITPQTPARRAPRVLYPIPRQQSEAPSKKAKASLTSTHTEFTPPPRRTSPSECTPLALKPRSVPTSTAILALPQIPPPEKRPSGVLTSIPNSLTPQNDDVLRDYEEFAVLLRPVVRIFKRYYNQSKGSEGPQPKEGKPGPITVSRPISVLGETKHLFRNRKPP